MLLDRLRPLSEKERISELRREVKGYEEAIRGAYLANHGQDASANYSTASIERFLETAVEHAAELCEDCINSFEARKRRLVELETRRSSRR